MRHLIDPTDFTTAEVDVIINRALDIINNREMYANGEKRLIEIAATLNKTAKLLLFTQGGPEDIAYNNGKEMLKVFDKCGIKYEFSEMPGGHSWHVWRHDLHNLAPRLFK